MTRVATVVAGLALLLPAPQAPALQLAAGGVASQPIVIASGAGDRTQEAAHELRDILEQITGALFSLGTGDGSAGIVVGTLAEFPDPDLADALEIRDGYDGVEAFVIRTDNNRLRLIGTTDLGASHAVYAFLESIGCRWFFPAEEWTIIPSIPTLDVDVHMNERPDILCRRIWYGYGFFDRYLTKPRDDYDAWARHNRMAQSHSVYCGHAWQAIISANQDEFDAHPEYYALVSTNRQGPQLCVSNPEVRAMVRQWALDYLDANPDVDMVSVEPSDGSGHCEGSNCLAMGSISERVFGLANEVADAVAARHPGRMVGLLAYNDHSEFPSFAMRPNVHVQLTRGFTRGAYTFDELLEMWPAKCSNMGLYEYFSVWLWDWDMLPGGRGANVPYIRDVIPEYVDRGMLSLSCESGNNWGPHGRGYYLANKLMWDSKADADAILADFYEKAFGPGAEAMQRYYERVDPGNTPLLSEDLLALAFRDVDEAATRAAGRADIQARIDHIKQYLHYVHLYWEYRHGPTEAERKEAALAALTHCYRTRYSYMNHWAAMYYSWTRSLADEFDEPTWDYRDPDPPWKVESPMSHGETESAFQEGLARFTTTPVTEVHFSDDLVPAGFTSASPAGLWQQFLRGSRYAFYSTGGSPVVYDLTPGIVAWYRDRADATLTLTDRDANTVDVTRLPLDGEVHAIATPLPRAGLYWLDVSDSGAGARTETEPGRPSVLRLEKGRRYHHSGHMRQTYFYVPRGTEAIQYFISNSTDHDLCGPNGSLYRTVSNSDVYVSIPVPAGWDGQVWSIKRLVLGQLWFFNCPNVVAASPDALLLPRELVERDGLPGAAAPPDRAPRVTCAPGADLETDTRVRLAGELLYAAEGTADVSICWGTTNGGFNTQTWTHVEHLGWCSVGLFEHVVEVATNSSYVYQVFATNGDGWAWAPVAAGFQSGPWPWPFHETFEECASGSLDAQHGWEASPGEAAEVQTRKRWAGIRAARVSGGSMRRGFSAHADTNNVWVEMYSQPEFGHLDTAPSPTASAAFYVNPSGHVVALDGTNAVVLTNRPALEPGEWVRFVLCLDYHRQRWDLWQDGELLMHGFRFYSATNQHFKAISVRDDAQRVSYHDDIMVSTQQPANVVAAVIDDDHDGLPDAWERLYFNGLAHAATNDNDGDGLIDLNEYLLGTNPLDDDTDDDGASDWHEAVAGTSGTNASERFAFTDCRPAAEPGSILLAWPTVTGRYYRLYYQASPGKSGGLMIYHGPGDGEAREVTIDSLPAEAFFRLGVEYPAP